jgi:hypothetical protein
VQTACGTGANDKTHSSCLRRTGVQEELEALAAAEAQCCAFVARTVLLDGGQPVLRVTAPEDRPEDIESIARAFAVA